MLYHIARDNSLNLVNLMEDGAQFERANRRLKRNKKSFAKMDRCNLWFWRDDSFATKPYIHFFFVIILVHVVRTFQFMLG